MTTQIHTPHPVRDRANGSSIALYLAAGLAALIAMVYLLIGLRVLEVIKPTDDQPAFGFVAAGFFLLLAVVLLAFRRRTVWVIAALIQPFIIFVYFNLASEREPSYELWGITLRVLQVPLVLALVYLLVGRRTIGVRSKTE